MGDTLANGGIAFSWLHDYDDDDENPSSANLIPKQSVSHMNGSYPSVQPTRKRYLWEVISLFEFMFIIYFASGVVDGDGYKIYFLCCYLVKQGVEKVIKYGLTRGYQTMPDLVSVLNLRPLEAFDCDALNKGGKAGPKKLSSLGPIKTREWGADKSLGKPGFPSGHTTCQYLYFTLHLLNMINVKNQKRKLNLRSWVLMVLFTVLVILTPVARVQLKCHTTVQVVAGVVVGIGLGAVAFAVSQKLVHTYPKFQQAYLNFYSEPIYSHHK